MAVLRNERAGTTLNGMKLLLVIVCSLLVAGCGAASKEKGGANSPGGQAAGSSASPPAAAQQAATNGAYNQIGTNVSTERAANAALANAATNAPNIGGAVAAPGGTAIHGGTGTGDFGTMFWIYVALDAGFLVWLVLAIRRRLRKPSPAGEPAH